MSELYDNISPKDRARIGKIFLADCEKERFDIDILIDKYIDFFGSELGRNALKKYLNNLADLITEPN